jgi:ATP-dependent Clp protease ATP-binding subunit ClpC
MYERFTDRARRILVIAQEQAKIFHHSYIGTEHLLLGMLAEGESIAAQALDEVGLTLQAAQRSVHTRSEIPRTGEASVSQPLTPRAKRTLELGIREALQLGHSYVGPEHLLLGLMRNSTEEPMMAVAGTILFENQIEPAKVRSAVIKIMSGYHGTRAPRSERKLVTLQGNRQDLVGFRDWLVTQVSRNPVPEGHPAQKMIMSLDTALRFS